MGIALVLVVCVPAFAAVPITWAVTHSLIATILCPLVIGITIAWGWNMMTQED